MSNLIKHAEREFQALGYEADRALYDGMCRAAVMDLLEVFSKQGHSGGSANIVIQLFTTLAKYEALTPLSGDDSEWVEYATGRFQNNRCSHVFKDEDGMYDSEGRIFKDTLGGGYTNRYSRVPVTFPYTPKRVYVKMTWWRRVLEASGLRRLAHV